MNTNPKLKLLPPLMALLGIAALVLRTGLYLFARDAQGLLSGSHPYGIALWAVTAFATVLTCLMVFPLKGSADYSHNFGPSFLGGLGVLALAAGIGLTVYANADAWGQMERLRNLTGLLLLPALLWVAICRWRGRKPPFLFHALVCVYLTLYAVSHYQAWSSRPQLQDYFFVLMGCVLLNLFAYYQTAFDVGLGKRRMQLFTGLLAAFFSLAAAAQWEDPALYLGGAVWALTNLCRLNPVPQPEPAPEAPAQDAGNPPA